MSVPFLAIVGTQSSGSSAIAGLAYHVGVWMGSRLGGRYGGNPDRRCGFEDRAIYRLTISHCPDLCDQPRMVGDARRKLFARIAELHREAEERGTIAGAKLPRLSCLGDLLVEYCGDGLRVIGCNRPIEDAIRSIQRIRRRSRTDWAKHQRWMLDKKERFLAMIPPDRRLDVAYYDALQDPKREAMRIAEFLGLSPSEAQLEKAIRIVHPKMRHIR